MNGWLSVHAVQLECIERGQGRPILQHPTLEGLMEHGLVFAGNPDSVYRQIMRM
jgi:hypothetical protein